MTSICERLPHERVEPLAGLIEAEYKEMPGMRLTFAQAKRLWNLSDEECMSVLDYLVDEGRLARHGQYFCRGTGAR